MFNNSNHRLPSLHLSAPLWVIVCCYAQLPASELGCYGRSLSAFGCSEGNQLWQSCKLFLWRAKGPGAHTRSRSPYLHQEASRLLWAPYLSGLKGPSQAISMTWTTKRGCLVCRERVEMDRMCARKGQREEGEGGGGERSCWEYLSAIMW